MNAFPFFVPCRDLQESGVEGAHRASETRGSPAQGFKRNEEKERCRGPGLMPVGFGVRPCGIRTALGVSCRISRSEIHLHCGICTYKFTYYWTNVQLEARWLHLPSRRQAMYNARCIPTARVCPTSCISPRHHRWRSRGYVTAVVCSICPSRLV